MLTYVSRFWSGGFEPFWPHVALLTLSVLASFSVGGGIIFERPKYSAVIHRVAFWLVVVGIAIEAVCTIFLFVFDEGISTDQKSRIDAQQSVIRDQNEEIKALYGQLLPRSVPSALTEPLREFGAAKFPNGPLFSIMRNDAEAAEFAAEIVTAMGRTSLRVIPLDARRNGIDSTVFPIEKFEVVQKPGEMYSAAGNREVAEYNAANLGPLASLGFWIRHEPFTPGTNELVIYIAPKILPELSGRMSPRGKAIIDALAGERSERVEIPIPKQ
jgi:hypothetical protein